MIEHGRLGGAGSGPVVMGGDGVQKLGEDGRIQITRALLDHPEAEVDVAEEPTLIGLTERRSTSELADAPHVVEERGGQEEIVP